ncbi:tetratricopeptide repeat protein [Deinococcus sp. Marseille-Q6407]|uniref:tetratricopeptide repeat protein n=1 Tax=Deinococcus sp. Marseille-Q6407 TaxID=2969223 RepID=UPI0021C03C5B|nr:tetratricopeptide repeat protein [Deinococcus sp. Marseille-Q6407]
MSILTSKWLRLSAGLLALTLPAAQAQAEVQTPTPAPAISASNYVTVGQFYYGQGNFQRAAVAYDAAVRANPTNPDALLGLARSQTRLGQSEAAAATLNRLIELDPANISARIALSQAYSQAFRQSRLPQPGSAESAGTRPAANSDPQLRAALSALDAAEGALSSLPASRRGTEGSKIWNERGYVLRFQGDLPGAVRAFQQASRLNPQESVILFNLAETQYASGDLPGATATIQRAVLAQPRDGLNRAYFARLLAEGGNFAVARPQAALAVQLAPASAYAAGQYGVVSYLAREPRTAREQLERAPQLSGGSYPDFSYYLGRLNLDAGDLPRARANFADAATTGENPEAFYYLGLSLERSSAAAATQPEQAAAAYRRALALRPVYPQASEGLERLGQRP